MEEESAELREIRDENREFCKLLDEHYLRNMLIMWLTLPMGGLISFFIGLFLGEINSSSSSSQLMVDLQALQNVNSDVFLATLTVAGFIIGIVPLLSFFLLGEIKRTCDDNRRTLNNRRMGKFPEVKRLLDTQESCLIVNQANLKKAIKRYTQIAVGFSIAALVALIFGYLCLGMFSAVSSQGTSSINSIIVNLLFNFLILLFIVMEVFPLARIAFVQPGFKVIRLFDENGEELALVMPDA